MPKIFSSIPCANCNRPFRPKSSRQKCCTEKCLKAYTNKKLNSSIKEKFDLTIGVKNIYKLLKNKKFKITDHRTINYPDSPTGQAYIGVAKKPLQAVDKGYGFKGVLTQTDNRMFVQCHMCGKWMRKISSNHLSKHRINKEKYCEKFGLYKSNGLVADATSYKLELAGIKRNIVNPNSNQHLDSARVNAARVNKTRERKVNNIIEHQNRYAICEAQLGYRLIEYVRKYKTLPSRSSKNEGRTLAKALFRRYGSLNEGFKHYNLPHLYRTGTNVELVAPDNAQMFFNYNKRYNRDEIYNWMIEHSQALQGENIYAFND